MNLVVRYKFNGDNYNHYFYNIDKVAISEYEGVPTLRIETYQSMTNHEFPITKLESFVMYTEK